MISDKEERFWHDINYKYLDKIPSDSSNNYHSESDFEPLVKSVQICDDDAVARQNKDNEIERISQYCNLIDEATTSIVESMF